MSDLPLIFMFSSDFLITKCNEDGITLILGRNVSMRRSLCTLKADALNVILLSIKLRFPEGPLREVIIQT
jgi:hypothetical protein